MKTTSSTEQSHQTTACLMHRSAPSALSTGLPDDNNDNNNNNNFHTGIGFAVNVLTSCAKSILLSVQSISSIGQIIKSVCVSVSQSVSLSHKTS